MELLDDPAAPAPLVRATLRDIRWSNTLFGGTRAVLAGLEPLWRRPSTPEPLSVLDIGTGAGDIPLAVSRRAARRRVRIRLIGLEIHREVARVVAQAGVPTVVADGEMPPFAEKSIDVVIMSQVLHHLPRASIPAWLRRTDRLARRLVVITDLRRTWAAKAGIWLASYALGFHPVSRHDGVLSVRRGFTPAELRGLLAQAGIRGRVTTIPAFRVVAAWEPHGYGS